jgi:hypothetical protein
MREECFQFDSTKHRRVFYTVSCFNDAGSMRDDTYWTSRENSLELTELSSIKLIQFRFPPVVTLDQ